MALSISLSDARCHLEIITDSRGICLHLLASDIIVLAILTRSRLHKQCVVPDGTERCDSWLASPPKSDWTGKRPGFAEGAFVLELQRDLDVFQGGV